MTCSLLWPPFKLALYHKPPSNLLSTATPPPYNMPSIVTPLDLPFTTTFTYLLHTKVWLLISCPLSSFHDRRAKVICIGLYAPFSPSFHPTYVPSYMLHSLLGFLPDYPPAFTFFFLPCFFPLWPNFLSYANVMKFCPNYAKVIKLCPIMPIYEKFPKLWIF